MKPKLTQIQVAPQAEPQEIFLTKPGRYRIELNEPETEVRIRGGWWLKKKESAEIVVDVIHQAPHCRSDILLRGIASDAAHLTIRGTIEVLQQANHTQAFLTENVLLLSPKATAEAVPNLEIACNEVKCSHAATVSPIPEEHLFYLASRGLSESQATDLLAESFLRPTRE